MTKYEYFTENNYASLKGKLKPLTCAKCFADGERTVGSCPECLKNRAYNIEWLETHSFIADDMFRSYHCGSHDHFKELILRMPGEHPYLYCGAEVEIEFDPDWVTVNDPDYYDDDEEEEMPNDDLEHVLIEFSKITDGLFVYERDGSLDNGVELISRPCSYAYWTSPETVEKLKKGFEYLRKCGALIDQPNGNGVHIHASRKFFEHNVEDGDTERALKDFDWVFQKYQEEIEKLGQREYTTYCASKKDVLKNRMDCFARELERSGATDVKMSAKIGRSNAELPYDDHHTAVNLRRKTIEVRVFKSTTDYKTLLSYIEIVRNVAHAARSDMMGRTLDDILHTKENLYLDDYIRQIRMQCRKNKEDFSLEKVNSKETETVSAE